MPAQFYYNIFGIYVLIPLVYVHTLNIIMNRNKIVRDACDNNFHIIIVIEINDNHSSAKPQCTVMHVFTKQYSILHLLSV